MSPKQPKPQRKREPCPACGGSGTIPWADTLLTCANCDGSGKVNASGIQKPDPKDRG